MGLWGAAQAIAFGAGGFLGTVLSDIARLVLNSPGAAYAVVFALEAIAFFAAAWLAANIRIDSTMAASGGRDREPLLPSAYVQTMQQAKGGD